MLLRGKTAVITGAGRGIGACAARLFAQEGAKVAVHYFRSGDSARELAQEIGGAAFGADLTDPQQTQRLAEEVFREMGDVDILINAASTFAADLAFGQASWDDFAREFAGVVGTTVNPIHAFAPRMAERGGGKIVNFMATLVYRPATEYVVHATAKSALIGLTRSLARELGPQGITVNLVSPGMTLTEYSLSLPEAVRERVRTLTPLRRLAAPEDAAKAALFYASPLADMISGANIAPDGGLAVF